MTPEEQERLQAIARQTYDELYDRYTDAKIKEILRLIKRCTYSIDCPEKFRGYTPKLTGTKATRVRRISSPNYTEGNKSKTIQEIVVNRICSAELTELAQRTSLIEEGWIQILNTSGEDISHWCFRKSVIEHYLVREYGESEGNPFTFFKTDKRSEACHGMWVNDIRIAYRIVDQNLVLGFDHGFMEGFEDFVTEDRGVFEFNPNVSLASDLSRMQFTQESTSEAHNFSIIWHLFREQMLEFLRIPDDSNPLFKGGHRMRSTDIGQVEIDCTIAWISEQRQGRVIAENKGSRTYNSGWNEGFSIHQLIRPFQLLSLRIDEHNLPCQITPIFCRFEQGEDNQTWNALIDIYEVNSEGTINWVRGLNFIGIPN